MEEYRRIRMVLMQKQSQRFVQILTVYKRLAANEFGANLRKSYKEISGLMYLLS